MATTCFNSLSPSSTCLPDSRPDAGNGAVKRFVLCSYSFFPSSIEWSYPRISCSSVVGRTTRARVSRVLGVAGEEEAVVRKGINGEIRNTNVGNEKDGALVQEWKRHTRPCELYVCNLPTSCDIAELLEMFKPFGIVLSVEVGLASYPVVWTKFSPFSYLPS